MGHVGGDEERREKVAEGHEGDEGRDEAGGLTQERRAGGDERAPLAGAAPAGPAGQPRSLPLCDAW